MRRGLCAIFVALLFPAAASAHTDAGWQLAFRWPADGTITSPFGHDGARWHPGLDIGILRSLDVRAAAEGVVTQVGFVRGYEGYGSVVLVRHGDGYSTLYAHLSRPLVHVGEHVGRRSASPWRAARAGARARTCTSSFATGHPDRSLPPHRRLKSRPQGRLAQLGEHQLDKLGVTGSSPVPPTRRSPATAGLFSFKVPARVEFRIGYVNEMATAGLAAWLLRVVLRPRRKK